MFDYALRSTLQGDFVQATGAQLDPSDALRRVLSGRAVERLVVLVAGTGFLALGGPEWLAVALPGTLLNFLANPSTVQAGLTGHYLWPLIPWLFWAAIQGGRRLSAQAPRLAHGLSVILILVTVIDSPLRKTFHDGFAVTPDVAADMASILETIPAEAAVLAQANLIPHLPHRRTVEAIGTTGNSPEPEWVMLTRNGDLWPLDLARVAELEMCYGSSPDFVRVTPTGSSVLVFRRTGHAKNGLACR